MYKTAYINIWLKHVHLQIITYATYLKHFKHIVNSMRKRLNKPRRQHI